MLWTVVLALTPVAACSSDDTYLPALLADPMASYEADGIELTATEEFAESTGPFRKPVHAQVVRTYRIEDQGQAQELLLEAAAFAELEGWRVRPSRSSPTVGYGGTKQLPPGEARLGVSLSAFDPLHDPDGPRVLRISLDYGPVLFDESPAPETEDG